MKGWIMLFLFTKVSQQIDSLTNAPTIPTFTNENDLFAYWITLVIGLLSGEVVKLIDRFKKLPLTSPIKLVILFGLSYLSLKSMSLLGIALPTNPLEWDSTTVNSVLSSVVGWIMTKLKSKKTSSSTK